jgi:hypothetical protein
MPVPHQSPRARRLAALAFAAVVALVAGLPGRAPVGAQSAEPLPDARVVAAEVRRRAMTDREMQSHYTFVERREEIEVSVFGKVKKGPVKTYEVYPSVEPGNNYKRLIAVNGRPLSSAELEKQDRKHRDDVMREMQKREHESPAERAKRQAREARERADREAMLDEVLQLFDIRVVGRDRIEGHPALIATMEPKPKYRPRTEAGEFMKKMRARVWVSETDYQIIRAEGEMIGDVTIGWGLAGRIYKGSRAVFERTRVNGEVWLPSRVTFIGSGRALVFRRFAVDTVTTFSDYRKFTVSTEEKTRAVQ